MGIGLVVEDAQRRRFRVEQGLGYAVPGGFPAERHIDPGIDEEVFGSMMAVFIRGLQGMAADQAAPEPT